jgi:hypothetical protein
VTPEQLEQRAKAPLNGGTATDQVPRLADLLEEIAGLIATYILLPLPGLAILLGTWIANTYCFERFHYCGYLALRSATPRCGKTRLLRLITMLVLGTPPIVSTPTAATLFRTTRKVLILDEVDRLRNADKESYGDVLQVLDHGFEAGGVVQRTERKGGAFEVKEYPVYGPKAIAGIEALADTLADRTFQIQMERTPKRMPRLNARRLEEQAQRLRLGLLTWGDRYDADITEAYDGLPDEVAALADFDDRFQDIAEPLIVLASLADAERPDGSPILPRLLDGLRAAAGRREPSGRERDLLAFLDLVELRLGLTAEVFLRSTDLVDACHEREELSKIETTRALAGFLRHFDLTPKNRSGKERGYLVTREWVDTWRGRYGGRGEGASEL